MIARMNLKLAKKPRKVHMRGRRLLPMSWWPVGPHLVFDQTVTPIPDNYVADSANIT
jgi:hypothetical protein